MYDGILAEAALVREPWVRGMADRSAVAAAHAVFDADAIEREINNHENPVVRATGPHIPSAGSAASAPARRPLC